MVFALLFIFVSPLYGQVALKPNLEIFIELITESLIKELPASSSGIIFAPDLNAGLKREADLGFQKKLLAQNVKVYESPSAQASEEWLYDLRGAETKYHRSRGKMRRDLKVSVSLKRLSDSKEVIAITETELSYHDYLSGDVKNLEDARYPETMSALPPTIAERITLPAIMTATLGVIVWLFFNVRSQ
jgi:hypothetical protein